MIYIILLNFLKSNTETEVSKNPYFSVGYGCSPVLRYSLILFCYFQPLNFFYYKAQKKLSDKWFGEESIMNMNPKKERVTSEKYTRDGAKYVCTRCKKKYFSKDEVEKCYDGHPVKKEETV